jgi:enamine deaminase RidA (YjgF/YER057c/UK114 family)
MATTPEKRIQELHLMLPVVKPPKFKYKPTVLAGNMLYVSGHVSVKEDGSIIAGKLGADMNVEQGAKAARQAGIAILATVRAALGSLDKVKRLVKTLGMVNATADATDQPLVINGFSELMAEVFGEDAGVGARSAVGMGSLPGNAAVEVECIFEVAV